MIKILSVLFFVIYSPLALSDGGGDSSVLSIVNNQLSIADEKKISYISNQIKSGVACTWSGWAVLDGDNEIEDDYRLYCENGFLKIFRRVID